VTFQLGRRYIPISADSNSFTYTLLNDASGRFALDGDRIVVANGSLLDRQDSTSTHDAQ
jgi:hypothetical protein